MYRTILTRGYLCKSQRKGIITLIPKSNDVLHTTNYRPITLLCADYKILAKILSERMKLVLHKVIYQKQFCGIPGRSINQCNIELRDLLHYANKSNLDLAIINLDWYKAFDLVPVEFVFKVLHTLGFGDSFVSWIKILYTDIESAIDINNQLSEFFPVSRSVRQGCPLSMGLFILFQEPFYRAIVKSRIIRPLRLPDSTDLKIIGYADDSTIIVMNEVSLIELFNIISKFEKAMGSRLNKSKTKLYGIGNWQNRTQWPVEGLQIEHEYFHTLGISHSTNYQQCLEKNWGTIIEKLKIHSNILNNRKLTLHQRVTYANSCMMSKIWYVAHIYPLSEDFAKEINKIVFHYIWGGRYEPIKRNTVCKPKSEGGLGIINCLFKARTLFINTFLKCYTKSDYPNSLMNHYCYLRLNNIIPINYSIYNACHITTPYYEVAIVTARSIIHLPGFPSIPKDKIYRNMFSKEKSLAELQYPTFNWQKIWHNYQSLFILSYDKEIIYKYLHLCLATNKKLFNMNLITTGNCS